MQVLVASSNPHKIDEIRQVLGACGVQVVGLDSLPQLPSEPAEDGDTFEANSQIKAITYAKAAGRVCLADDSGLEVDALDGSPGVHSARYAEMNGISVSPNADRAERDHANNTLLLEQLRDVPQEKRTARFVCVMCLADERGKVLAQTRGTYDGVITDNPRGSNGFGYDPLLQLEDGRTSAELSPQEKNARSHRGKAVRAMAEHLRRINLPNRE